MLILSAVVWSFLLRFSSNWDSLADGTAYLISFQLSVADHPGTPSRSMNMAGVHIWSHNILPSPLTHPQERRAARAEIK